MVEHLIDALSVPPTQRAAIACVLCGLSCSLLSVFVVLMKMPLIGVSMSHAAFAGAVLGLLLNFNPFLSGLILCLLVAGVLGPLSDRTEITPENVLGITFSFLMGVAFLGLGILTRTKAGALNLMWGSLLTLSRSDIVILTVITSVLLFFILLFFKEIRSVLFNRRLAASSGVPERLIYYALLFLTGAVVSSNLATVGGLLIFALLVQPGATALQLTYNLKHFFLFLQLQESGPAFPVSPSLIFLIFHPALQWFSWRPPSLPPHTSFRQSVAQQNSRKGIYPMKMTSDEIYRTRKQYFDDHADRWLDMWYKDPVTGRYDKHEKDFRRLFSLLPLKPGDQVLDVGCGTGVLVPFVLERITSTGILYELDFSEKMIEANRGLHPQKNIRFIVSDAKSAPLEEASCDVVICFSCFPHFHDKEKAMRVLSRILKPHGVFAVSHFNSSEEIKKTSRNMPRRHARPSP